MFKVSRMKTKRRVVRKCKLDTSHVVLTVEQFRQLMGLMENMIARQIRSDALYADSNDIGGRNDYAYGM